ncbi:hypothetical protein G210_1032 [Candida maltosa Xu316]|uniref:Uncharacterized protein n=1 Tax=Candida maltosa (strain Xu316) TaxID=1245528 RepID=M3HLT3_CANMX|nr:hypothetical protein G210_1032 [Candida maltosa Xu316]
MFYKYPVSKKDTLEGR